MPGDSRRDVTVRLRAEVASYIAQMRAAGAETKKAAHEAEGMNTSAGKMGSQIDRLSGRLRVAAEAGAVLGPSFIPVTSLAIPALAGLATQAGFAALAGGVLIGSFQGVGDALKAVNKAQLQPTTENLAAARLAMKQIGPDARDLVRDLRSLGPELRELRDTGAAGAFPGLIEGLDSLEARLPDVERIVKAVSGELGDISSDTGASLASDRWDAFFEFLADEGPHILADLATATGNVTHAAAEMWMAFDPVNDDFSTWLVKQTQRLDEFATGLDHTEGFQEFVGYIESNGPQVGATLGAIANALLQIIEAAAPLGGPVLKGLEAIADVVASIADSDLGTPIFTGIAALSLLNRTLAITRGLSESSFAGPLTSAVQKQATTVRSYAATLQEAKAAPLALATAQREAAGVTRSYNAALMVANKSSAMGVERSVQTQARLNLQLDDVRQAHLGVAAAEERANAASTARTKVLREGAIQAGKTGAAVAGLALVTTGASDKVGLTNTATLALAGSMLGLEGAIGGAALGAVIDLTNANDGLDDSLSRLNEMAGQVDLGTFNKQLADSQKKIDDLKHVTSVGDALSDTAKAFGYAVTHPGQGHRDQVAQTEASRDAAQAAEDAALRERGAAAANREMAASSAVAAHGFQLTGDGARQAALDVDHFTASMQGAEAVLTRQGAWDKYRGDILDAEDAVKKAGKTLTRSGDIIKGQGRDVQRAGLESRATLRGIAQDVIDLSTKMKDTGRRAQFIDDARSQFISLARSMGISKAAANDLADEFHLLNTVKAKPTVEEQGAESSRSRISKMRAEIARLKPKTVQVSQKGADDAKTKIMQLKAAIAALRDRTVTITERRRYSGNSGIGSAGQVKPDGSGADGMTIPGARYPYRDSQLILAAPGEELITNRHGEADRFRSDRAAGRIPAYADGGSVGRVGAGMNFTDGKSVTVVFPPPAVYAAAVKAADDIAAAAVKTTATAKDLRAVHLDDLHQQQQIRDLQKSLNEHNKKTVGKGKSRHTVRGKYTLQGLDRDTAKAELADAKATLAEMRKQSDVAKQLADAQAEARQALDDARKDAQTSITGGLDLFSHSAGGDPAYVQRFTADVAQYGNVIARLRNANASPILLQQMVDKANQGDFRSAIRLGQALLEQPSLLGQLNASLGTLGSVSGSVAALTTDPRFLTSAAWNPAGQVASTQLVQVQLGVDPSTWTTDITRRVTANVLAAINGGG